MLEIEATQQNLSLAFIILVNACALAMVYTEYRRSGHRFTMFVGLGQLFNTIWHLFTIYLAAYEDAETSLFIASVLVLASSVSFLHAAMLRSGATFSIRQWQASFAILGALLVAMLLAGTEALTILWILTSSTYLATPWFTLRSSNLQSRWLISSMQLLLAPSYGIGIAILLYTSPEIGGLMYFFVGMLVPTISLMYLQESVQISAREISLSETIHRELFDSVRDIFYRADPRGQIEVISSSIENFGYKPEELIGKSVQTLYDDPLLFPIHQSEIANGTIANVVPLKIRTKSDVAIECELSVNPILDSFGMLIAVAGTVRDVSERNQLERQFLESQRRESLGVLAGGMAHDFNNLLQGIVGRADLLMLEPLHNREEVDQHLSIILEASSTAALLCKQLLEYTGKAQLILQPICIESAVSDVVDILRPSIDDGIELALNLDASNLMIDADLTQIRQVVLNLVKNAIEAVEEGPRTGRISINVERRHLDNMTLSQAITQNGALKSGDYACIEVQDSGYGIDASIIDRIFDPFYSTKHSGHGLGLASISGILRSHNGGILVESAPGVGSKFCVILPSLDASDVVVDTSGLPPSKGNDKVILVVDDEPNILTTTRHTLRKHGYQVITAKDGDDAIESYRKRQDSISAVLMDIKMPNKDGIEASREIRSISPSIPIILASGYGNVSERLSSTEANSLHFLSKPYRGKEVLTSIEQALGAATA